jgi:hypothetical protein
MEVMYAVLSSGNKPSPVIWVFGLVVPSLTFTPRAGLYRFFSVGLEQIHQTPYKFVLQEVHFI